ITAFAHIEDAVAARLIGEAVCAATIAVDVVAIVAGFVGVEIAIATERALDGARCGAAVAIHGVAIVAGLSYGGVDDAVSTGFVGAAAGRAAISAGGVAIVACLAETRVDHVVSAR